jgi:hypothetical protein
VCVFNGIERERKRERKVVDGGERGGASGCGERERMRRKEREKEEENGL